MLRRPFLLPHGFGLAHGYRLLVRLRATLREKPRRRGRTSAAITRKTSFNTTVTPLPPPGAQLSAARDRRRLRLPPACSACPSLTASSTCSLSPRPLRRRRGSATPGPVRAYPADARPPARLIVLDEVEDAHLKLADLRPLAPPRPSPRRFSRLVRLPADAELTARAESIRGGGLRVTVPKYGPPTRPRSGLHRAGSIEAGRGAADAGAEPELAGQEGGKADAAAARDGDRGRRRMPSSQVLVECAASAANVQSPKEFVEHWKATPEGGFKMTK